MRLPKLSDIHIDENSKKALLKALGLILGVIVVFSCLSRWLTSGGQTLADYAANNPDKAYGTSANDVTSETQTPTVQPQPEQTRPSQTLPTQTQSANENGDEIMNRTIYQENFYYEPLSDEVKKRITGISYPALGCDDITYDDLCYLHVMYVNFDSNTCEGEIICNKAIAEDLVEIFYSLYQANYQIESIKLIEEFDGDDTASMSADNTSCFNYRNIPNTTNLSNHALGLAIDINPFYNPYITYDSKGGQNISPVGSEDYADRSLAFPYKIDKDDYCYRLFTEHGFNWGGDWNSSKDYQHFQKILK